MRLPARVGVAIALGGVASIVHADCTANTSSTDDLQRLLTEGGQGYKLSLCAGQTYTLDKILNYTAVGQEISTEGYPRDSSRATLLINGFNVTTAVQATDSGLDFIGLRNVQINGNRAGADIYEHPGANIEIGGDNNGQIVEYVKSWDPRGWSCLHIAEGPFRCRNVTIQNNDIGPCGSDQFQEWADGISLSCQSSLVQNNDIVDATDGGIVIFGSPNSTIRNNNIHVKTRVLLGGINMVDPVPWPPEGNFSHVVVEGNSISGGFATDMGNDTLGSNNASAMIKIGIAIGPRTWFSDGRYGTNQTTGAIVRDNVFSGAFAFAIGMAGVEDCQLDNNTFTGNVSFIGEYGPNCTAGLLTPHPPIPLLYEQPTLTNVTIDLADPPAEIAARYNDTRAFQNGTANGLTCFLPPASNSFSWPYGVGQVNSGASSTDNGSPTGTGGGGASSSPAATSTTGAAGRVVGWPREVAVGLGAGLMGIAMGGSLL